MTIRILICDNAQDAERLREHLLTYCERQGVQPDISRLSDPDELCLAAKQVGQCDIIFMDTDLDGSDGIEIAREIRRANKLVSIVFATRSTDRALDAFSVYAAQYLIKPIEYDDIARTMEQILIQRIAGWDGTLTVAAASGAIRLELSEFAYSETQQHYQLITLTDGSTHRVRISCSKLYDMLAVHPEFVKLGASFVVNIRHVVQVTSKYLRMINEKEIPVPRGAYSELKKKYLDYFAAE